MKDFQDLDFLFYVITKFKLQVCQTNLIYKEREYLGNKANKFWQITFSTLPISFNGASEFKNIFLMKI